MLNKALQYTIFILIITGLSSCDFFKNATLEEGEHNKLLAVVGDNSLYYSDIIGQLPDNMTDADSADIVYRIVDIWLRQQLLVQKANQFEINVDDIDRKVESYRNDLLIFELKNNYLKRDSSKISVSEDEIVSFYEEHSSEFQLQQNLLKCKFAKVSKQASEHKAIKKLLKKNKIEDAEELKDLCSRFADKYFLDDSLWLTFEEVVSGTPFMEVSNQENFLRYNTFKEMDDSANVYCLHISGYKLKGEVAPLSFHHDRIRNILVMRKKKKVLQEFEDRIYKEALKGEEFEIYK